MSLIEHLFTSYADAPTLTEAEEASLIESAQAGSSGAQETLLLAYGRAIRAAVRNFSPSASQQRAELDDLRSAAVVAFLEIVASHDPAKNPRLAGRVAPMLADALAREYQQAHTFTVPERSLKRFLGILKEAGESGLGESDASTVQQARKLAPERLMSVETFDAIFAALGTESLDAGDGGDEGPSAHDHASPVFSPSPVVDVEDKILVDAAFRALDDEAERIVSLSYGFTEYDPVPDAEIGHRMGLTRPTVQRKRGKALVQMRKALGVAIDG